MASGKSKNEKNKFGIRRIVNGEELAPKSLRKKGKKLLKDCTSEQLKEARVI